MTPKQLPALAAQALLLQSQVLVMKTQNDQTIFEHPAYEIALLKLHTFAKHSEHMIPAQSSLLHGLLDTDLIGPC